MHSGVQHMQGEYLKPGDEVTIHIEDQAWNGGYAPVDQQHGVQAQVVRLAETTFPRVRSHGLKPGVYRNQFWAMIKPEGRQEYRELVSRLRPVDEDAYKQRVAEQGKVTREEMFIRELPETTFWEGDTVRVSEMRPVVSVGIPDPEDDIAGILSGDRFAESDVFIVHGIEYGRKREGEPWMYTLSDGLTSGWHIYADEPSLTLIERGNVWKYFNGETPMFADLNQEVTFFNLLGHRDQVRNPARDSWEWSRSEFIAALTEGTVDATLHESIITTRAHEVKAVKFRDEDLGARVRTATIDALSAQ